MNIERRSISIMELCGWGLLGLMPIAYANQAESDKTLWKIGIIGLFLAPTICVIRIYRSRRIGAGVFFIHMAASVVFVLPVLKNVRFSSYGDFPVTWKLLPCLVFFDNTATLDFWVAVAVCYAAQVSTTSFTVRTMLPGSHWRTTVKAMLRTLLFGGAILTIHLLITPFRSSFSKMTEDDLDTTRFMLGVFSLLALHATLPVALFWDLRRPDPVRVTGSRHSRL